MYIYIYIYTYIYIYVYSILYIYITTHEWMPWLHWLQPSPCPLARTIWPQFGRCWGFSDGALTEAAFKAARRNGLAQKERSWDGTPMEHHGKNHGKPWKTMENHGKTQGKTMEHHVELIWIWLGRSWEVFHNWFTKRSWMYSQPNWDSNFQTIKIRIQMDSTWFNLWTMNGHREIQP